MKVTTTKTLVTLLSAVSFVTGLCASQMVMAEDHHKACTEHVQNKIAWDYDGRNTWEPANIERLCKGTTAPKAPGECFNKVMQGQVKWGSDAKWEWQNAVSLCAGANNADERITCFQKRVKEGEPWNNAILQCQTSGSLNNKVPM